MKQRLARMISMPLMAVATMFVVAFKGAIGEVEAPKELLNK
ncbi:hypothetical protein ACFC0X_24830 [Paenibacillus chitinolyticus]